jgi:hypothetical protein
VSIQCSFSYSGVVHTLLRTYGALWNLKGEKGAKLYGDMAISDHGVKFTILTNDKYVAARIRDIQ